MRGTTAGPLLTAVALALTLVAPATARAQDDVSATAAPPALDAPPTSTFGDAADALPGGARLAAAGPMTPGLALALAAGYGYRGATLADDDRHHRNAVDVAASFRPVSWLAIAARFAGRYDVHRGEGRDEGWVGDPRIAVRVGGRVGGVALGAQVGAWLPGGDAPSIDLDAATLEALGLAALERGALAAAMHLGVRLDRSARSIEGAEMLSPNDRLALGVSDAPTILAALGGRARGRAGELFAEVSWDAMLGDDAPPLAASPLRAAAGWRVPLGERLALGLRVEALLSDTPSLDVMEPLAPVEPTFAGALTLTWSPARRAPAPPPIVVRPVDEPKDDLPPPPAALVVTVTSNGGPVADAAITLTIGGQPRSATTGADGTARFDDLPAGGARVAVTADGMRPGAADAALTAGATGEVAIALERDLPPGQLRGVVRSSRGKPLAASLRVVPGGAEIRADAHGEFQLDLPPGEYDVEITADGYAPQSRRVVIPQDGVTILNVDMVK